MQHTEQPETALSKQASQEITPLAMLSQAVSSGADVDVLERLMGLQERWEERQARREFTEALSHVRQELPRIVKDRTVAYDKTKYKHEDLGDLVEQISPVLGKHGLSFRWRTDSPDGTQRVSVSCILEHSAGHSETTTLTGPYDTSGGKNAIQSIGSAVTYLQRYTLKAALGIAASHDDDGRGGDQAPKKDDPTEKQTERLAERLDWAVQRKLITAEQHDATIAWSKDTTAGQVGKELGRWEERTRRYATAEPLVEGVRSAYEGKAISEDEAREYYKDIRLFVMGESNVKIDLDALMTQLEEQVAVSEAKASENPAQE